MNFAIFLKMAISIMQDGAREYLNLIACGADEPIINLIFQKDISINGKTLDITS